MTDPRPGWYSDPAPSDPAAAPSYRWWDGTSWTDDVSDSATAPPPVDPHLVDQTAARAGHRSQPTRIAALMLGIALLVGGGVVGTVGWIGDRQKSADNGPDPVTASGSPSTAEGSPPAAWRAPDRSGPVGRLNEVSRKARIADATMTLPPDPYTLSGDSITVPDVIDAMFVAGAPVHPQYDGAHSWSATVGLAHLPGESVDSADPVEFADDRMGTVAERFFGDHRIKIKQARYAPLTVDGQLCAEVTARIHYRIEDLASRYDNFHLVGCPSADGGIVAAISSVPDDADPEVARLAAASVDSLELD